MGEQAQVLIDLGHHPQGTNIEFIVSYLIVEGKLGGFHFNCRKYADDDLTVGSVNPQELFLIYHELVPGHHFHISTMKENQQLSDYRRGVSMAAFTALVLVGPG